MSTKIAKNCHRILVIDDNPDIHNDFQMILSEKIDYSILDALAASYFDKVITDTETKNTYDLDFAFQGEEALEKIKNSILLKRPFSLAFVDMRMPPGWDGLETIERIWNVDANIQVVICTAYSDYSWKEINKKTGKTDKLLILKKPFDAAEITQLASTLTEKWDLAKKASLKMAQIEKIVRKKTKDLAMSNKKLQKEIIERKQLEQDQKKLQTRFNRVQKMEAVGLLAAGVAHDLNNILSGIVSYPELLLMDIPRNSPLRKPLLTIQNSGKKAADIVKDLLTLARTASEISNPVNLNTIVYEFLKTPVYKNLSTPNCKINIKLNLHKNLLNILGSPVHLSKAVMNLFTNAAEAMPHGGTIFVSTENRYIDKPVRGYDDIQKGNYTTLTISDTGVGISPADLERIFEPFYTKKLMGRSGSGLGMPIVWGTVKDHKGYIDIKSTKGKGTSFILYFPVTRKQAANDKAPICNKKIPGKGESVLVVDDVPQQREIAVLMLNKLGYSATSVSSGEKAVEYIKRRKVDLLVLDMIMDPGINGLETYKRILEIYPDQKAIIASGYSETDHVKKALRLGAGTYIKKPYLLETIRMAAINTINKQK